MATSKCGSCGSSTFEMKAAEPRGSKFKLTFVQCAACGAVVSSMDFMNIGAEVAKLSKQLTELESSLGHDLAAIATALSRRRA